MAAESDPACPDDSLAAISGTELRMGALGGGSQLEQVVLQRDGPLGVHGVDSWRRRSSEPDGDSSEEPEECTEHGVVGRLVSVKRRE